MLIQFSSRSNRYGPLPFMYQNIWSLHANFFDFMKKVWKACVSASGLVLLAAKLKNGLLGAMRRDAHKPTREKMPIM